MRHGLGTALIAVREFGAIHGKGFRQIVGRSWGIITTDLRKRGRPSVSDQVVLDEIEALYNYAKKDTEHEFWIAYTNDKTPNLSGFSNQQFADMFSAFPIPDNIVFNDEFSTLLNPVD